MNIQSVKKIKPMFTALVTTMDRYKVDVLKGSIIDVNKRQGSIKEYQRVLFTGSQVREIKVGDLVCIDPTRFGIKKHKEGTLKDGIVTDNSITSYIFDTITLNTGEALLLQDRDIKYIIEEYEEETIKVCRETPLELPPKKSIIV